MDAFELRPGAWRLGGFLSTAEQRSVVERCAELARGPAGFYTPTVRGGRMMRLEMLCLGRHWNAMTYEYEATRSDYDGLPAPALPDQLADLARGAAAAVDMAIQPDICIVNRYAAASKLGLHQDKDERAETLAAGIPIVSLSLGDTSRFLLGCTRRRERVEVITLRSGDAFVMGGASRMRYHGVAAILAGTGPSELGLEGRLSLTFRQYGV